MHVAACVQFSMNLESLMVLQLINSLTIEVSAILDSLFHKLVNTTSTPRGVGGGGRWVAMKWCRVLIQKLLSKQHQFRLF